MAERKKPATVPNVARKMDPHEQARITAQIGNLKKQNSIIVTKETGVTRTYETKEKITDLKKIPTVYIKDCKDCVYTIDQRTTKLYIEKCTNLTINLNGSVLTRVAEIWNGDGVVMNINTHVKTLQVDMIPNIHLNFNSKKHFEDGSIVWNKVDAMKIKFQDAQEHDLVTGFDHMKSIFADSDKIVDQFIVRFLEGALTPERCIRLKNGFLSTEREAIDWEKRNVLIKERYLENFQKEAGITISKVEGKKVKPNEKCTCGSGKKYKKCCFGKQEVTGVAGDKKIQFK